MNPVFRRWCLNFLFVSFVGIAALRGTERASQAVIALRDLPLLFVDEAGLLSSEGVARTVHPAHRHSDPVVQGDRPWEAGRVYVYGSIYPNEDGNGFRLWYLGRPEPEVSLSDDRLG